MQDASEMREAAADMRLVGISDQTGGGVRLPSNDTWGRS